MEDRLIRRFESHHAQKLFRVELWKLGRHECAYQIKLGDMEMYTGNNIQDMEQVFIGLISNNIPYGVT